jgi:hypothetical protein
MIGQAVLAIWFGIDPAGLEDFDRWYARQHLPERLSVPGFLRGRRYAAVGEGPPFFTLYELDDGSVATSAAYLERLNNPTDWTRRVLPTFRHMLRNPYRRLAASPGDRWARHLATVRITPAAGNGPAVRRALEGEALAALARQPGVVGAATYESDTGGAAVQTEERKLIGGAVRAATPFLALLELADPGEAAAVGEVWRAWGGRLAADVTVDVYRLLYGLSWLRPDA